MDNYSLSDLAAITKDNEGFGGGTGAWWIILFLIFMMGGGTWGNRNQGELNQWATAAGQNELLLGQKFDALGQKVNQIGDGLCSSTYALNNTILSEGRALQTQLANCCCENQRNVDALRYDMATMNAATNANVTAQTQKILDAMCAEKMAEMQSRINQLETANVINAATAGVVKYPMATTYSSGVNPFCGCGCNI